MQRLLPLPLSLPLFNVASSRAIEAAALAGLPVDALMERAGLAVARLALALQPGAGTIWVACGPGNNGGDGRIAARLLQAQGRRVSIGLTPPADCCLAIDALLGLGLNRTPDAAMAAAITALNSLTVPVLAVDLPSGLLADSGALAGAEAVRATHTLCLLSLKPGLFTAQGRAHAGTIWFDDLAIAPARRGDAGLLGRDCLAELAGPDHAAHKGSQGDVLVIGGAPGMRGAARLAARAALAAGAGRVYLHLLGEPVEEADPARAELMLAVRCEPQDLAGKTVAIGCGGGQQGLAEPLAAALRHAPRLIVDADALNAIAASPALQQLLRQRAPLSSVLTPHPLEAARLLGTDTARVQADRLDAAQALAERCAATIVLKGSGSVIASPGRRPQLCSSGSAALASAGSGDVLAGWIAGLWAPRPAIEPHLLAGAASFWHGLAGEQQAAGPLRAGDLIERMHALHAPPED
ncbi:NAD(P)H-hydrate dehydratase [Roseateles violae]|uniref:Bifunctional NAD(P)H-hydrate repair enzyme n=1 Tax=Roseateles violae TaxID=3058042 RepID=A0ABT8DZQ1_9BURK|nr:NAD(P)H-hydrate dehydratase [Pelomonas sp. PFR6]MDN3923038.1 NAD(P)H-hydrate dehydratase [Pelomonas sp. PFR6]